MNLEKGRNSVRSKLSVGVIGVGDMGENHARLHSSL